MGIILETGKETLTLEVERYQPQSKTYVCSILEDDNGDCDWLIIDEEDIQIRHGHELHLYTDTADFVGGGNFVRRPVNNDRERTIYLLKAFRLIDLLGITMKSSTKNLLIII